MLTVLFYAGIALGALVTVEVINCLVRLLWYNWSVDGIKAATKSFFSGLWSCAISPFRLARATGREVWADLRWVGTKISNGWGRTCSASSTAYTWSKGKVKSGGYYASVPFRYTYRGAKWTVTVLPGKIWRGIQFWRNTEVQAGSEAGAPNADDEAGSVLGTMEKNLDIPEAIPVDSAPDGETPPEAQRVDDDNGSEASQTPPKPKAKRGRASKNAAPATA